MPSKISISGGQFQDAAGNPVASGHLVLTLSQNANVSGTAQVVRANPITIDLDSSGNAASTAIWGNDNLTPSGTTYNALVFDVGGGIVYGPETWSLTGAGPIDLSTVTPATSSVSYSGAVVLAPTGNQSVTVGDILPASGNSTQALGSTAAPWNIQARSLNTVLFAENFSGADIGAKINAAHTALPSTGGKIVLPAGSQSMSTAVNFATASKPVLVAGSVAGSTVLNYSGTGAAFTFNCDQGAGGMQNLSIVGPGSGGSTTGILVGGTNGAAHHVFDGLRIESFGTGVSFGNSAYVLMFRDCRIYGNGTAVNFPSGLTNSGENITFLHCVFSGNGGTSSDVTLVGPGGLTFEACSFDQSHLVLSNNLGSGCWCQLVNCHHENPQAAQTAAWVQNNGYYFVEMNGVYINDFTTAPTNFIAATAGDTVTIGNVYQSSSGTVAAAVAVGGNGRFTAFGTRQGFGGVTAQYSKSSGARINVRDTYTGFDLEDIATATHDVAFGVDTQGSNPNRVRIGGAMPNLNFYAWTGSGANMTPFQIAGNNSGQLNFLTGSNAAVGSETYSTTMLQLTSSGATIPGTLTVQSATPTGSGSSLGIGNTTGFGNGTSGTAVTTSLKGTGSGPATPQTVVKYLEIDLAGTKYWIPLVQ